MPSTDPPPVRVLSPVPADHAEDPDRTWTQYRTARDAFRYTLRLDIDQAREHARRALASYQHLTTDLADRAYARTRAGIQVAEHLRRAEQHLRAAADLAVSATIPGTGPGSRWAPR